MTQWSEETRILYFKWRQAYIAENPSHERQPNERIIEEFEKWVAIRRLKNCHLYTQNIRAMYRKR